jgi:hypothetical protein
MQDEKQKLAQEAVRMKNEDPETFSKIPEWIQEKANSIINSLQ